MEKKEKEKRRDDGWIAFTQASSASQVKCRHLLTLNYMQVIEKLILTPWGAPIKACQISAIKFDSGNQLVCEKRTATKRYLWFAFAFKFGNMKGEC